MKKTIKKALRPGIPDLDETGQPILQTERLLRLADVIEIKHKHFGMGSWADSDYECGMTGCIGGFAVAEFHPYVWNTYKHALKSLEDNGEMVPDNGHIQDSAEELLGLTSYQAGKLFYQSDWPQEYKDAYNNADFGAMSEGEARKEKARVAASLLRAVAKGTVVL